MIAQRRRIGVVTAAVLIAAACAGGTGDDEARDDEPDGGANTTSTTDVLENPRWANVERGPEASSDDPVTGGSLVVGLETETDTFAPWQSQAGQPELNAVFAVFDPLVTRDADGELRPYLAESIEPNEDSTEWTLTLRPGLRFHDGTPLNAQALKRNWDDYVTAEGAFVASTASQFVERLDVVDELTVTYVMTHPNPTFPELLELQLGWPFSPDAADERGDAFGDQPVGTGPFKFVSRERGGDLVLERNPDYWQQGRPLLDRITFRLIPDETTRVAALEAGDVDVVQSRQLSDIVADVSSIDGVRVVLGTSNGGGVVLFNTERPPTDDQRIRQSLAHAVDRQALVEVAAGEAAALSEPLSQFFPSDSPLHSEAVEEAWPAHDPDAARERYEDYIADPDRSDGKPAGEPVSLTVTTRDTPMFVELAEAVRGFYEDVGYEVAVEPVDQGTRISAALSRDYEVMLLRIGRDSSPLGEFVFYLGDPTSVVTNFTGFHDDTVRDVIEGLRSAGTREDQATLTERLGLHLAEQIPWQWTGSEIPVIAAAEKVRGLRSWTFPDGTLGDSVSPGASTFWGHAWIVPE